MTLGQLIEELRKEPQDKVVKYGFDSPHSYRGIYAELAFEPAENVKVSDMLKDAEESLGKTFTGYKGGDFEMGDYTTIHLAEYGSCGEEITLYALAFMLGRENP